MHTQEQKKNLKQKETREEDTIEISSEFSAHALYYIRLCVYFANAFKTSANRKNVEGKLYGNIAHTHMQNPSRRAKTAHDAAVRIAPSSFAQHLIYTLYTHRMHHVSLHSCSSSSLTCSSLRVQLLVFIAIVSRARLAFTLSYVLMYSSGAFFRSIPFVWHQFKAFMRREEKKTPNEREENLLFCLCV